MPPAPRKNAKKTDAAELRRLAEAQSSRRDIKGTLPQNEVDLQRLVHELQVHQIELEIQNEELHRTRADLETSLDRYTDLYDFAPVVYFTLTPDGIIRTRLFARIGQSMRLSAVKIDKVSECPYRPSYTSLSSSSPAA